MLLGNDLWDEEITSQLVRCNYRGRKVFAFSDAPQNMYADLHCTAEKHPNKLAIVGGDGAEYTYSEFLKLAELFAGYLSFEKGVKKGDHIAIVLLNSIEFCACIYALASIGAVAIPLSTKLKAEELKAMLSVHDIKLVVHHDCFSEQVSAAFEDKETEFIECSVNDAFGSILEGINYQCNPYVESVWEDDFIIMHTSGTTSKSKGVVLTNFNIVNAFMGYKCVCSISEEDSTVIATPMYHITGLVALLMLFVHSGGTIYLKNKFSAPEVLECIKNENVSFVHASPTVFQLLLENKKEYPKLPGVRMMLCGSANMPPKYILELNEWMPEMSFITVYGLTESSSLGTGFPSDAAKSKYIGSSGRPMPGVQVKLIDDEGHEAKKGQLGELCLRSSVILDRYYEMKSDSLMKSGWFKTGDIASINDQGYVYIVDRKKDMINRGGEKVWSYEVENVIMQMPEIAETVVLGAPDSKYGEVVMALIRLKEGCVLDKDAIVKFLKDKVANYKLPVYIDFVSEIKKTTGNKIDKRKLKQEYTDAEVLKKCKMGGGN